MRDGSSLPEGFCRVYAGSAFRQDERSRAFLSGNQREQNPDDSQERTGGQEIEEVISIQKRSI